MDKNKLVIIGNGFDSCHGLKTSYSDYHKKSKMDFLNKNGIRLYELKGYDN